ncbi:hypothetical protein [Mesorhizobium sp. LSHC412B00]|uniref:hypothetical protein n=1 Tax=Mesorhizobium sp. LSHC412B00 TaxID=1287285 RepID=UPI0003CE4D67|nr:hypothetical protein [Mesorhizobium sp. LSHC412B00]ESX88684.1 hypothetical protein X756_09840 [Mesorhizobium sp. LSHC412B00]
MAALSPLSVAGLSVFLLPLFSIPAPAYDLFNITHDHYAIPISGSIGSNVVLGTGLILDDPTTPIVAPFGPFKGTKAAMESVTDRALNKDEIDTSTVTFIENTSAYEYSKVIQANMKATFDFGSGGVAYSYMKSVTEDSDVIIAIIRRSVTSPPIDETKLSWASKPRSEDIDDPNERLKQFINDNGSHYVQAIRYGYRVAVYGRIHSRVDKEVKQFKSAFKAAFSRGVGGYGIDAKESKVLTKSEVELKAEVTSGKIVPETSPVLTTFSDINDFLKKVKNGDVTLYPGPIEVQANSYWHTLIDYPKTRKSLDAVDARLEALYGVPKGSIISWSPPQEAQRKNDDGTITIVTPEGWKICDGNGAPDLTGKFVMGTGSVNEVGLTGGSIKHTHKASVKYVTRNTYVEDTYRKPVYRNNVAVPVVSETEVLPPYVELVYLMRM